MIGNASCELQDWIENRASLYYTGYSAKPGKPVFVFAVAGAREMIFRNILTGITTYFHLPEHRN